MAWTLPPHNVAAPSLYLGKFDTELLLFTTHPTALNGNFAWVMEPKGQFYQYYVWDEVSSWVWDTQTQRTIDAIDAINAIINL